jgi:hypothetical protein
MLEQLLYLLAENDVYSYRDLMEELSVSMSLLEMALNELARLGYLHAMDNNCAGACHGCALSNCSVVSPGHLWTLTEKGARAASRLASQSASALAY